MYFGLYDTLKPMLLGADAGVGASFVLGWCVTITAGLMSYPIGKQMLYLFKQALFLKAGSCKRNAQMLYNPDPVLN